MKTFIIQGSQDIKFIVFSEAMKLKNRIQEIALDYEVLPTNLPNTKILEIYFKSGSFARYRLRYTKT